MATFNSISTKGSGSSKASVRFGLDEEDKTSILVYKYRSGQNSLEQSTQHDLCKELDSDPQLPFLRVTKKKIPRGNSRLEIRAEDLLNPEDLEKYRDKPTLKSSVANVGLGVTAKWKHLLFNSYEDLFIVSRTISASAMSSRMNSAENSQNVSPSTTFKPTQ